MSIILIRFRSRNRRAEARSRRSRPIWRSPFHLEALEDRITPVSFAAVTSFAVASEPRSVVVADVNGDGKPDLVTANAYHSNVSVLLGTGNGAFGAPTYFAVGSTVESTPRSVAVADVDSDGKPDIVTANYNGNISVLLGTGNGSFGAPTQFAAGTIPRSVVISDINGDGKPDIVAANDSGYGVNILLGMGNGSFEAATNFPAGMYLRAVAVTDVNGDGKPDIVTANDSSHGVNVLLGMGNGSFGAPTHFAAGKNPRSVAVADINGDGKPDIVTANPINNNVSVLLGTGNGSFGAPTHFTASRNPGSVAVADVNGDGKPDIVTVNYNSNDVSVLLGRGDGSFEPATNFPAGEFSRSVAVADVNGDGKPDIVTANYLSSDVSVLLNAMGDSTTTTVTVTASGSTSVYGQNVVLIATVTNSSGDGVPTGTVEFFDGSTSLGTGSTLSGSGATATSVFTTSTLGAGSHASIRAVYTPYGFFLGSNGSTSTLVIDAATPGVNVIGGPYIYDGQPHAATAIALSGDGTTSVAGSFTFTYNGSSTPPTEAGTYAVVATFVSDDTNYKSSTTQGSLIISPATPTVSVIARLLTYNAQPQSATATAVGLDGTTPVPGTFTFTFTYDTGNNVNGVGSPDAPTQAGRYTVVAHFTSSDINYRNSSSDSRPFTIGQANATIVITPYAVTYDGTAHTATGTATGVNNESLSSGLNLTGTTHTNAGTYNGDLWTFHDPSGNYADATGTVNNRIVSAAVGLSILGDVYILNQTASGALNISGNAVLNVNGTLRVASSSATAAILGGNAYVDATQTRIVGGKKSSGNAKFDGVPTIHDTTTSVADPLAALTVPTGGTSFTAVKLSNGTLTLNPGVYSSISVSGNARLLLNPGIYIIGTGGITVSGNASVTNRTAAGDQGVGVLLYNNGALTVSGNASVDLTADSRGMNAGVAIFQARSNANAVTVSGNAKLDLNGNALYVPNVQSMVTFSGNAQVTAALVVNKLTISGNAMVSTTRSRSDNDNCNSNIGHF